MEGTLRRGHASISPSPRRCVRQNDTDETTCFSGLNRSSIRIDARPDARPNPPAGRATQPLLTTPCMNRDCDGPVTSRKPPTQEQTGHSATSHNSRDAKVLRDGKKRRKNRQSARRDAAFTVLHPRDLSCQKKLKKRFFCLISTTRFLYCCEYRQIRYRLCPCGLEAVIRKFRSREWMSESGSLV
jgi:hypothetical protein